VRVSQDADGATVFAIEDAAAPVVKGVKPLLRDLPDEAEAGWWSPTTPKGRAQAPSPPKPVLLTYPWENRQTPWACAGEGPADPGNGPGSGLRRARHPPFRALRGHTDPAAPLRGRRRGARGPVGPSDFPEGAYGLTRFEQRTDVPAWAAEIDLVLMQARSPAPAGGPAKKP
jgi:hypothetical protein